MEKYDKEQELMGGGDEEKRNRVRMFIHAAEGTFMVHCLAITYARWFSPPSVHESGDLKKLEEGLAINVGKDLDVCPPCSSPSSSRIISRVKV